MATSELSNTIDVPSAQTSERIRFSARRLKRRIIAFSALISVAIWALVVTVVVEQRNSALERVWSDASNLSAAFEEQIHLVMNNVASVMDLVKQRIETEGDKFDLTQWGKQLSTLAAATIQISIIGPDGKLVSTTLDHHPKPIDLSDREHFRVQRDNPNLGLFVGKAVRGRISGQVSVQVTKRLTAPDGGFGGVLVFSLDPEMLTSLHRHVDIGDSGSVTLVGTDGVIRARLDSSHVMEQDTFGKQVPNADMFVTKEENAGNHVSAKGIDGVERLFDWRKVEGYPLIVCVGLGKAEALTAANRHGAMIALLGGVGFALLLIMMVMLTREISRRVTQETAFAQESEKLHKVYINLAGEHGALLSTSAELAEERAKLQHLNLELQLAKYQAEKANDAKSLFLANMSHELRTPLNGVLGMAQALSAHKLGPKEQEMLEAISYSSKTLMAIINDILDLSKIEAGKIDVSPIDADITYCLSMLHRLFLPIAEEKGLDFTLTIDRTLPTYIRFDPLRVRQCVSNLISNALKFTEQGAVNIKAKSVETDDGSFVIIVEVSDTGIGLSEDVRKRLFSAFMQADGSTSRRYGGTGLGLVITRRLAGLMGGDVVVTSEMGRGSTFAFSFRAKAGKATHLDQSEFVKATANDYTRLKGLKVLSVDDNAVNRKVVHVFLEPHGATVVDAVHGGDALDRLKSEPFDVVLMDVHMPVMDGAETIQNIRASGEAWSGIPVIALTADALSNDREQYLTMGMDAYLSKPIDQHALILTLTRLLNETEATSCACGLSCTG
jgi:signal transduction histidine kinase/ActR/RegA family two-component response regulator